MGAGESSGLMETRFFATPAEFRSWLMENHASATELGVVLHSKASGKPSMTWSDAVDQALCFGWIDGLRKRVDETRYMIRFTPRKPTSIAASPRSAAEQIGIPPTLQSRSRSSLTSHPCTIGEGPHPPKSRLCVARREKSV